MGREGHFYNPGKKDQPTSPKKSRSVPEPEPSGVEGGALSPPASEWTSVRISPVEDAVGQDVMAVCVLVTSDDSSSETESDYSNKPPHAEPFEERTQQLEAQGLTRHTSLREVLDGTLSTQHPEESKAMHALRRANSFQCPTPSKYSNWRRKFQWNLTPVNNKGASLPPMETSPSLSSSWSSPSSSSPSSASVPDPAPHGSFLPPVSQSQEVRTSSPNFPGQTSTPEPPKEIPLYLPHHEVLERAEYCLVSPGHDGLPSLRPRNPEEMGSAGCQEVQATAGNTRSIHRGLHPHGEKDRCWADRPLSLETAEDTGERSTGPRRGEGGPEMAEEKKSGLKKLTLTPEQKSKLLDWNGAIPANLRPDPGEQPSQRSPECWKGGRVLKPVRPLTLPQATRETLPSHRHTEEKVGTPAEQALPEERSPGPPKSPLRLIANAIRRSLEPLFPNSEGGKKIWAKSKSKTLPSGQPPPCARSQSLRKTISNKNWYQQSQGRDTASKASSFLSLGTPAARAARPSDPSPPGPILRTHSLPNRPSKVPTVYSPCSKMEDVPTLLEKVSLQETSPDASRAPNRRLSLFSSLRLKDGPLENFLQESRQRMDFRDLFSSPKDKTVPTDQAHPLEVVGQPLSQTSLGKTGQPPSAGDSGPNHISIQAQATERASSLSSTSSSSADEEFDPQPALPSKKRKTIRRRRKLETETKQLIKQEELKRLHKAQAIQRQLEEVEEWQRAFEIQGVRLEKALRGEADSGAHDEAQLLQEWFKLVLEKNKLTRYESELLIMAHELELEDNRSRLERRLREKMLKDESLKDERDRNEEQKIFTEMMQVIEQRDRLVESLEKQRIQEKAEDQHLESFLSSRGCPLSRT